jgi:hypothetical protein
MRIWGKRRQQIQREGERQEEDNGSKKDIIIIGSKGRLHI